VTQMRKWIRTLRVGAVCCLLPAGFMFGVYFASCMTGDYTVGRKYHEHDQYRINAIGPGEIDAPYSQWFYKKAEPGDAMHFGFHYITLHRNGRFVAFEIPSETRNVSAWILLAVVPLTAFVKEERMPIKRTLLSLITGSEIITLSAFVIGLFV